MLGCAANRAQDHRALDLSFASTPGPTVGAGIIRAVADRHPAMALDFVLAHLSQVNRFIDFSARSRFVNESIYLVRKGALRYGLDHMTTDNAQGEEYLTDAIGAILSAHSDDGPRYRCTFLATERPGEPGKTLAPDQSGVASKKVTYTNNWPSEPLVGNTPPPALWLWSAFSVVFLLAGIAALGWHHAVSHGRGEEPHAIPASDPFALLRITPSMRATAKYFWVVLALFLAQILLGAITAHYQVEGQQAYGFALSEWIPYSLSRTWHTQLAVLWIAVAWLGTGLYIAPELSGHEPRFQRLGVNLLFVSLLLLVVGSFAG
jgi:hypothetical protein